MIKAILFASAVSMAVPALAQDKTATDPAGQTSATAPQTSAPVAPNTAPIATQDRAGAAQSAAAAPAQSADAAATPSAAPVTGASQIAQVVSKEFPSYDKNADGNLDKAEFAAWMVALKTASDPSTKASDPAVKSWTNGAFASADTDKSAVVSQDELTKYLSIGAG